MNNFLKAHIIFSKENSILNVIKNFAKSTKKKKSTLILIGNEIEKVKNHHFFNEIYFEKVDVFLTI